MTFQEWLNNFPNITQGEITAAKLAWDTALKEAEGTMRFYAREYSWRSDSVYMCGHSGSTSASRDAGKRARDFIKEHYDI